MAEGRHAGQFEVTLKLLAELLHLPEGATVTSIMSIDWGLHLRGVARVVVEHPDLPEWVEGAVPVDISPSWNLLDGTQVEFNDWGVQ